MTTSVGGATQLIVATAVVLVATIVGLVWVGRRMRRELGLGAARKASLDGLDAIPPALVKQALERGLVTSAQLATMTPIERQFVLTAVRKQLEAGVPSPAEPPRPRR